MGIKGTTWNRIISASKDFANFSASPKAFFANSEPSNGTKIFLYIPHPPTKDYYWDDGRMEYWTPIIPFFHHPNNIIYTNFALLRQYKKDCVLEGGGTEKCE
jgi:hypothetical protein